MATISEVYVGSAYATCKQRSPDHSISIVMGGRGAAPWPSLLRGTRCPPARRDYGRGGARRVRSYIPCNGIPSHIPLCSNPFQILFSSFLSTKRNVNWCIIKTPFFVFILSVSCQRFSVAKMYSFTQVCLLLSHTKHLITMLINCTFQ